MVDITIHPNLCHICRTAKASIILRRVSDLGRQSEEWLCFECYDASKQKIKDAAEDDNVAAKA